MNPAAPTHHADCSWSLILASAVRRALATDHSPPRDAPVVDLVLPQARRDSSRSTAGEVQPGDAAQAAAAARSQGSGTSGRGNAGRSASGQRNGRHVPSGCASRSATA